MKHNDKLTPLAQDLRKNMAKEERRLWYDYLRTYPVQFRRQVAFGNFIMDFYCAAAKLCIELDGSQHYSEAGAARDAERTAFLEGNGIHVLRFSNLDIRGNLSGVCDTVDMAVNERLKQIHSNSTNNLRERMP